jgi:hypothetical protein
LLVLQQLSLPSLLVYSGIFAAFLLPLGIGALSMTRVSREAFQVARICFIASGVVPSVAVLYAATQYQMIYWQRVSVVIIGGVAIGLPIRYLLRLVNENERAHRETEGQSKAPQLVIVAIDELKALLNEGQRLVGRFQEDSVKPTFKEVQDWRKRTRDCARQNALASLVTAKDLLILEKQWDQGDVLQVTAKFVDYGCFANGSSEMAVFQYLWGSVQRLKQLIGKIEGESTQPSRRTITDDQATKIVGRFKGVRIRPLMITTRQGIREYDMETYEYAMQVKRVFRQAGIAINEASVGLGTLFPTGVSLFVQPRLYNDEMAAAILDAIKLTGVPCKTTDRQVWFGAGTEPEINVIIGANKLTPSTS